MSNWERRHDDCMLKKKKLTIGFWKIYIALFTTNLFKVRSTIKFCQNTFKKFLKKLLKVPSHRLSCSWGWVLKNMSDVGNIWLLIVREIWLWPAVLKICLLYYILSGHTRPILYTSPQNLNLKSYALCVHASFPSWDLRLLISYLQANTLSWLCIFIPGRWSTVVPMDFLN